MQDILAISIVVLAASFLMHRAWRHFISGSTGRCSSCANCSLAGTKHPQELVTLTQLRFNR